MNNFYISDLISIKELVEIIGIKEIDFLKKAFLKGIIVKKNEMLNFETVKKMCKNLFDINIFKKELNFNKKKIFIDYFYISITGNVNSGKTTLIDFIFKKNISLKEIGKITQTISIFETYFYKKKIFFFDLPGHEVFNKSIKIFINLSNILFLIISVETEIDNVYNNIINIKKENNFNIIICINKIDIKKNNIYIENYKVFKISSRNGFGVKNLIIESINFFSRINNFNIDNKYNGIIINSFIKKKIFITTIFLFKGKIKKNIFFYFNNEKIFLNNIYKNNIEIDECESPFIFHTKNIYFPVEYFFSIEKNNFFLKNKEIYNEKYYNFDNFFIKSSNHTICIAILNFYNNLKNNNKIKIMKISLGYFTENDLNYCINFKCNIVLIDIKLDSLIKKKILLNNIIIKEFYLVNDVIDFFTKKYNFNKFEKKTSELLIKNIFPCGKNGKIAGCEVIDGFLNINDTIKVYKELKLIFQGKINTLKNKDKNIFSIKKGEECGITIKDFNDIEIGLKIISFNYVDK